MELGIVSIWDSSDLGFRISDCLDFQIGDRLDFEFEAADFNRRMNSSEAGVI